MQKQWKSNSTSQTNIKNQISPKTLIPSTQNQKGRIQIRTKKTLILSSQNSTQYNIKNPITQIKKKKKRPLTQ